LLLAQVNVLHVFELELTRSRRHNRHQTPQRSSQVQAGCTDVLYLFGFLLERLCHNVGHVMNFMQQHWLLLLGDIDYISNWSGRGENCLSKSVVEELVEKNIQKNTNWV